jgi:protein involved in polysaccharide export with SLBB domain
VRVLGAVRAAGRYEWSDEMSLIDLLAQAGGPTERADLTGLQILPGDRGGRATTFNLQRFLTEGGRVAGLPQVRAGYTITVPEQPVTPNDSRATWLRQAADRSIHLMGAVAKPGRYAFEDGLSVLDLLSAADGPTAGADLLNIRVSHRGEARERVSRLNLAAYFETGDESLLPQLRPGDVVYVPDRNRSWLEVPASQTVRVLGAVNRAGRFGWQDGMTILDLLAEAGGPTAQALQERIVVVNLSCCASQARTFDLPAFARSGDFRMLPVVRGGDTVYVPATSQSDWRVFFDNLRDALSVVSVIALLKVL